MQDRIYWQAHQSTSPVMPENTLAAFEHAWNLGGIPEADIRTTGDGEIICLHDPTLKRTTNAPSFIAEIPVSALACSLIRQYRVGGMTIPTLKEVFAALKSSPQRLLYLDLKDVDLNALARLIKKYAVAERLIFSHNSQENCQKVKELVPKIRTMLWIGGTVQEIEATFQKALAVEFSGLDQVQIHLYLSQEEALAWPYQVGMDFIEYAIDETRKRGLDLEVLPFKFADPVLHTLLDLGIRWFAVDYPQEFLASVARWQAKHN